MNALACRLCERAGLPPGVLSVVHGTVNTVNAICDHPKIKAISFVGGNRAGKHIYDRYDCHAKALLYMTYIGMMNRGTANGKRVQANMGAKNHAVIMPDGEPHTLMNDNVC